MLQHEQTLKDLLSQRSQAQRSLITPFISNVPKKKIHRENV
jgi:hypothetical protein